MSEMLGSNDYFGINRSNAALGKSSEWTGFESNPTTSSPMLKSTEYPQFEVSHNTFPAHTHNNPFNIHYIIDPNSGSYDLSPVPSYHSSNQSSPVQEQIYYPHSPPSTDSPQQSNTITTNFSLIQPQQQQQDIYNLSYSNVPSSPNSGVHPENYSLIYHQSQIIQQQLNSVNVQMKPINTHQVQQKQQQEPVYNLNTPYQPVASVDLQSNLQSEMEDFIKKPYQEHDFINQLLSAVPSLKDKNLECLSSSSVSSSEASDSSEEDSRPSKKRGRDESEIDEVIDTSGCSVLPKDKVLKLNSKEIEEYVTRLKENHVLTPQEEKDLKKHRRLIKNREYASQSRSRRKQYVEGIEQKLQKTHQDNQNMKTQINEMKAENRLLKKQLFTFTTTLKSNPSLAELFGKIFQSTSTSNQKAATSLSIFAIFLLFTFTFLFIPTQPNFSLSFNSEKTFLQRNLLALDAFDEPNLASTFSFDGIYEKSKQLKNLIYEESKLYIENMFGSMDIDTKEDNITDTIYNNNKEKESASTTTTTIVNPPKLVPTVKKTISEQQEKIDLISNSPPLSPVANESDN